MFTTPTMQFSADYVMLQCVSQAKQKLIPFSEGIIALALVFQPLRISTLAMADETTHARFGKEAKHSRLRHTYEHQAAVPNVVKMRAPIAQLGRAPHLR